MDNSSVVSAQYSVARSEAPSVAPSVAASEGGHGPRRSRRRLDLKKSMSTTSLDSSDGKQSERKRRSKTTTNNNGRRSTLQKSISMSAMNSSSRVPPKKTKSRRQTQPNDSDRSSSRRSSDQQPKPHRRRRSSSRRPSSEMNNGSNRDRSDRDRSDRDRSDRDRSDRDRSDRDRSDREREGGRRRSGGGSVEEPQRRRRSGSVEDQQRRRRSGSVEEPNRRSRSVRRKSDRNSVSKRTSANSTSMMNSSHGDLKAKRRSTDLMKAQSTHGRNNRRVSNRSEGELMRSTHHGSRSVSVGPSNRRKSSAVKPKKPSSRMSASENNHRTRKSMHQSLGNIGPVELIHNNQQSRPPSRRDLAKRNSVRTNGLFRDISTSAMDDSGAPTTTTQGGVRHRRRRETARPIREPDMLQMSLSDLNHHPSGENDEDDPLSGSEHKQNIYSLGILSADHLDRQPSTSNTSASTQPQEIVKVQFVQKGGQVVAVKSSPGNNNNTPEATPKPKTKKKLSKMLGFGMTPKKSKSKLPLSKYQTFDEDGDVDDDDGELHESQSTMGESIASSSAASWKDVDAAIPVLQL